MTIRLVEMCELTNTYLQSMGKTTSFFRAVVTLPTAEGNEEIIGLTTKLNIQLL